VGIRRQEKSSTLKLIVKVSKLHEYGTIGRDITEMDGQSKVNKRLPEQRTSNKADCTETP
jgi:hypothetical protein